MASNQQGESRSNKPDINRASQEELQRAEGIDGTMAEHIVRYRDEHGPFRSEEDLKNVPGVGETRARQVLEAVSLGEQGRREGGGRSEGRSGGEGGGREGGGRTQSGRSEGGQGGEGGMRASGQERDRGSSSQERDRGSEERR